MRPHSLGGITVSRIKLVLACGFSLVIGATMVWVFAPRAFRPLSTLELSLILGLMSLPLATFLAWAADRRNPIVSDQARVSPPAVAANAAAAAAPAMVAACPSRLPSAAKHMPRSQTHGPAPRHQRVEHQAHEHA